MLLLRNLARALPQRQYAKRTVTAMASKIVHWDSKTCPYAQRSWIALIEKGDLTVLRTLLEVALVACRS